IASTASPFGIYGGLATIISYVLFTLLNQSDWKNLTEPPRFLLFSSATFKASNERSTASTCILFSSSDKVTEIQPEPVPKSMTSTSFKKYSSKIIKTSSTNSSVSRRGIRTSELTLNRYPKKYENPKIC